MIGNRRIAMTASGREGVGRALRRLGVALRQRPIDPDDHEILIAEAMRVLGALPSDALEEAVSRFIDGRAGDGSGWAPTLVEIRREVDAICAASGVNRDGSLDEERAALRRRVGERPVFVGRHDPGWAAWEAWSRSQGERMPQPIQTINGFGSYFRAALPPETRRRAG
jgi:hypothetical protein